MVHPYSLVLPGEERGAPEFRVPSLLTPQSVGPVSQPDKFCGTYRQKKLSRTIDTGAT